MNRNTLAVYFNPVPR